MPKRVIHGEGIYGSDKLARVEPIWVRPEYANLIPLALANGVFEANAKRIWATVYAYNRPKITIEKVEEILASLVKAGLLFIWFDVATGKPWGFWVGIDKAGRLPSASRLKKGHDSVGPTPPPDALREYTKQPTANQWLTSGPVGFGSGFGSGFGFGSGNTSSFEVGASDKQILKPYTTREPSSEAVELALLLKERIVKNNPKARTTNGQVRQWALEADRLMRINKRTPAEIREVIEFSQTDAFWHQNILSMATLRKKFDQLWLKHKGSAKQGLAPASGPQRGSECEIPILKADE